VPAVQLREKDLPGRRLFALAEALRAVTARAGALLLVNDRVDVAIAVGADGVQLGAASMPVAAARRLLAPGAVVGVSTHTPAEVTAAAVACADFALFGPVRATPGKPVAQGFARLAEAARAAAVPVLAIGGMTADDGRAARNAGAHGVAVIRAILEAEDPASAARELVGAVGR
jgi:thiamine-phosphate pyrophosphorylase